MAEKKEKIEMRLFSTGGPDGIDCENKTGTDFFSTDKYWKANGHDLCGYTGKISCQRRSFVGARHTSIESF